MKLITDRIVLATHNRDKLSEMQHVLSVLKARLFTLDDFPAIGDIAETGETLMENAFIKARTVNQQSGLPAIADDTGLEVDALNGAPGVYSARYAGDSATYNDNVVKLLQDLKHLPIQQRTARFRSVVSYVNGVIELWAEGTVEGIITDIPRGSRGFGYDPVFLIPRLNKTFAELSTEEKNKISHRGLALGKLRKLLTKTILYPEI
ncbi:MAG: RdgB/HAM1 family non-canonical purine NTP pyrophosphatase [Candidatus Neomarinimicrobiota bacterium]